MIGLVNLLLLITGTIISTVTPFPIGNDNVKSTYIVFLHENNGGRSSFGSYESLIAKHRRLIEGDSDVRITGGTKKSQLNELPNLSGYIATLDSPNLVQLIRKQPETVSIEQDFKIQLSDCNYTMAGTIDTQTKVYSWGLDRVDGKLDQRFAYPSSAGNSVIVFVLDTGIRSTHADFDGNRVLPTKSFITGEDTEDRNGHGTHVAGTAVGTYSGVAKKARVQAIKVLNRYGEGSMSGIIQGLNFVLQSVTQGAKGVVNLSLGGGVSTSFNRAVAQVAKAGIPVVVAAGNENQDACRTSPASEPMSISVGSTTRSDSKSSFSNFGSCVDIQAPGSDIVSADYRNDRYLAQMSGTSMASPHVAGIVAVLLGDGVAAKDVRQRLIDSSQKGIISRLPANTVNLLAVVKV